VAVDYDVIVPTIGRPTLVDLLEALARQRVPLSGRVFVVDDRRRPSTPLAITDGSEDRVTILPGAARGPAAARNVGWGAARAPWAVFLDDDVLPGSEWSEQLATDLAGRPATVAGVEGRIHVPLPPGRPPTDWERNLSGLERARYATADMAYRRTALEASGGFDERFRRAYREDADLAVRLRRAGWSIEQGGREVVHPVGPADPLVSVRLQRGNADDALMRAVHGIGWRDEASAPAGRLGRHGAVVAAAAAVFALSLARCPKPAGIAAVAWLAGTAEFAAARIRPGPRTPEETAKMLLTSVALPFAAVAYRAAGIRRWAGAVAKDTRGPAPSAVLLDRDGTLIEDVPYNGDPERIRPRPGALEALAALRAAGVRLALVSNQSGVGRGLLTLEQVDAVNRRLEELLGPVGPWLICAHAPEDECECRKPRPGLVVRALAELGVSPDRCAMIGDIGADVEAALAAGVRPVLVPTARTLRAEVLAAPEVAGDLRAAVAMLIGPCP
jgi:histidinol-phosphate phosphatase family protein